MGQGEQMLTQMLQQQQMMAAQQQQLAALQRRWKVGAPLVSPGVALTLDEASGHWRQWSYKYELWLCSQWANGAEVLRWREEATATIDQATVEAKARRAGWEELPQLNRQMEVTLAALTKDTPGDIVLNSCRGSGCDAWRST